MTKIELNRDIKRLNKAILKDKDNLPANEFRENLNGYEKEFKRLYHADYDFHFMTKTNVLIMLALNSKYTFVGHNVFGMNINLETL